MTQRKNPFVRVKQTFFEDGGDVHWWVDEDELEEFKSNFCDPEETDEENLPKATATRELNGRDWNKFIIEQCSFDDHQGVFIDQDCPECGHFMVQLNSCNEKELMCSDCEYQTPELVEYYKKEDEEIEASKNKPPSPKIREVGQTLEQFIEKHFHHSKDIKYRQTSCCVCKRELTNPDFYIQGGYAIISFKHEDCTNGGPCHAVPFSQKKSMHGCNCFKRYEIS